ncbi:MAG TPA: PaaI family thioesterase [Candidatus Binatia bacterium]|nr:PaaI family thioesterase [Candidatus Binatia bacterium]
MTFHDDEELVFPEGRGCFGCSPENPVGLRLRFRRRGDAVVARYAIPDHFHGAPAIAHGGIVATILDEVSCAAVFFGRAQLVVTGELTVRYVKPCPVDRPLDVSARVTAEHRRYVVVEAEIREGDVLLARSQGKFFLPQARAEPAP